MVPFLGEPRDEPFHLPFSVAVSSAREKRRVDVTETLRI